MTETVFVDFETWNEVDSLPYCGVHQYARTLRILMMAYQVSSGDPEPKLWLYNQPFPQEIRDALDRGAVLSGWNSVSFERIVWRMRGIPDHGFPEIADNRWIDSAHLSAAANLPRSLEAAAAAVGAPQQKDKEGRALMLRVTNGKRTPWPPSDEDMQRLGAYCVQDVKSEAATAARLPPWFSTAPWNRMREVDMKINDRGILLDLDLIRGMEKAAEVETKRLDKQMKEITGGEVRSTSVVEQLKTWLMSKGVVLPLKGSTSSDEDFQDDEEDDIKSVYRLRKTDIADLLARNDIPDACRTALELRSEAAKASVKKLRKMLAMVSPDGRLRGSHVLGGAQQTLRFSGSGVQVQNLLRDTIGSDDDVEECLGIKKNDNVDEFKRLAHLRLQTAIHVGRSGDCDMIEALFTQTRKDMQDRTYIQGVLPWIGRMLRRTITAPEGSVLMTSDYVGIESRIPFWLAQQEDKLETIRKGGDLYRVAAAPFYGVTPEQITKTQRQIGKTMILACLAEGTPILTQRGIVPIERVTIYDLVWDGVEWVSHTGVVCNGEQEVIEYEGLSATRDHLVWVSEYERPIPFGDAASKFRRCVRSGSGGKPIRIVENIVQPVWEAPQQCAFGRMPMRLLRGCKSKSLERTMEPKTSRLLVPRQQNQNLYQRQRSYRQSLMGGASSVFGALKSSMGFLRRTWDSVQVQFTFGSNKLGSDKLGGTASKNEFGPNRQQRSLRAGQSSVGGFQNANAQSTQRRDARMGIDRLALWQGNGHKIDESGVNKGRDNSTGADDGGGETRSVARRSRCVRVYDITNAGPRHRYTAAGLLVHNCGFGGGVGAFTAMGQIFGIQISREEAQPIVNSYRQDNADLKAFWYANLDAAIAAVGSPGSMFTVAPLHNIAYCMDGNALCCRLPSGRLLRYWSPRLEAGYWPDGRIKDKPDLTVLALKGRAIFRRNHWVGTATENCTQSIAADMLAHALCNMEDAGIPVVLHVHDSVTAEVPKSQAEKLLPTFEKAMLSQPSWTAGLPIAVSCDISARFG